MISETQLKENRKYVRRRLQFEMRRIWKVPLVRFIRIAYSRIYSSRRFTEE